MPRLAFSRGVVSASSPLAIIRRGVQKEMRVPPPPNACFALNGGFVEEIVCTLPPPGMMLHHTRLNGGAWICSLL